MGNDFCQHDQSILLPLSLEIQISTLYNCCTEKIGNDYSSFFFFCGFVNFYFYFRPCSHIMTIFWCFCSWVVSTLGILLGDLTRNSTPWPLGTPQCWELHRKLILHIGHIHQAPLIMEGSIVLCTAQLH